MKAACIKLLLSILIVLSAFYADAQKTLVQYLSGTGSDHTVNWQFYCTAGRNSGKWTNIPVPSNWELQGFGKYNYGLDKDTLKGKEQGLYKYRFTIPALWEDREVDIVFDGSMTDTKVTVNGQLAGQVHQGAFYRFRYPITSLLKFGQENLLEVTVSKQSANASVNAAERKGDFWVFGGIFRPVFLEAFPKQHIRHIAVDGRADGSFKAQLGLSNLKESGTVTGQFYKLNGQKEGSTFTIYVKPGDTMVIIKMHLASPKLWSPEFPNLYRVVFTLAEKGKPLHVVDQRFGFRTVELRQHDGIYVNSIKIKFKGINHHSFWPTTGRTTSKALSIQDVEMLKDMNMNAVRMSHYPPDEHFLEVCDSLGLFVLDELTGWHHAYDTPTGSKLAKEMIARDVNHPSIVIWDNGNEGGFNFDLDHWFDDLDIQQRPLIHPWAVFRGTNTQHYINYDYGNNTDLHGHDVAFPTEFLHAIYDGGGGAGLDDFWELMWHTPISAGGFIWAFADEAVVRIDKNGLLDSDGDHGPDGIVGPYHEKEGSYYTIKEIWSPVYIERREITPQFDGKLRMENRYAYTNLKQCTFSYKLVKLANPYQHTTAQQTGSIAAPDVSPYQYGYLQMQLPAGWQDYDVLYLTAFDPYKHELFTWSWPISSHSKITSRMVSHTSGTRPVLKETDSLFKAEANGIQLEISRNNGILKRVFNHKGELPFNQGPVLAEGQDKAGLLGVKSYYTADTLIIEASFSPKTTEQQLRWKIYPSGLVQLDVKYWPVGEDGKLLGVSFSYPEQEVQGITYMGDGPYRVWKNRLKGTSLGVWDKIYNNTITGEDSTRMIYPEFKGYYSNLYWMKLKTKSQPITIVCDSRDVFLRLFTPQFPKLTYNNNIAPDFPSGNISFMHGITAIGTKSQNPGRLGPSGGTNQYFNYDKHIEDALSLTLYFDFSGK